MTDLSTTIIPKSDQTNADDLIVGPKTIRITKVSANPSSPEQPISISFEGDNDKPYKPGKSMRRVLVNAWGADASKFTGRSMTLYRDPAVKFGGFEVGGIRISHMTNIDRPITMALTATRANRKPFTVQPLVVQAVAPDARPSIAPMLAVARAAAMGGTDVFKTWWKIATVDERAAASAIRDELTSLRNAADAAANTGEIEDLPEPSAADAYALGQTAGEAGMSKNVPLAVAEFGDAHADAWLAGHDDGKAVTP